MTSQSGPVPVLAKPVGGHRASANWRACYTTFVLALVSVLAAADRNILAVLLVPIQLDLGVSDTAMGMLSGLAFSLVYASLSLPLARIADRGNRRNLIAAAVAFWSAMTVLCGFATNYVTLLLARMGVAAGESPVVPVQASIIGDLFTKRRGTAFGVVTVGSIVGLSLGAYVAGAVSDRFGWEVAFMTLGAPGLIVALLLLFTVPEPARVDRGAAGAAEARSWGESLKYLVRVKSLCRLLIGHIFLGVGFHGFGIWFPAFLMRVHNLSTAEMSLWYGAAMGVGSIFSNLIAGYLGDRLIERDARYRLYLMGGMMIVGTPIVIGAVLADSLPVMLALMILYAFSVGGAISLGLATGVELALPRVRGFTAAALHFCTLVVGGGLGPILLGAVNDQFKLAHGDLALRYTLLVAPFFLVLAAVMFFWSSRTANHDCAMAAGKTH